jgi:hypothetical protein
MRLFLLCIHTLITLFYMFELDEANLTFDPYENSLGSPEEPIMDMFGNLREDLEEDKSY